jgi:hypothetical protein
VTGIEFTAAFSDDQPWRASIERTGRWWWYVTLHQGLTGFDTGWFVFGSERRAEQLARRKIRHWNRKDEMRTASRREIL